MNETTSEYWKRWFDDRAKNAQSDFILNRATPFRIDELERKAELQLITAVDPQPLDIILDAGCGSGRNISLFSALVKEVTGIDYSEQMLERARERVSRERLGNVELLRGSLTELPFPEGKFDKVICASVLQYLDDAECEKALQELMRVARRGALIVLHVKNGTSLYGASLRWARRLSKAIGRPVTPEYFRSRSWHERKVAECGGTLVDFDGFGILTFVPLPNRVTQWLLKAELRLIKGKAWKKLGVNYKMTIRSEKACRDSLE